MGSVPFTATFAGYPAKAESKYLIGENVEVTA